MVSSCFIHRVPGIVCMGILSNGGAGSILLLGLLTGNEAVSGSKVGTPLIVVSIILLLSITAGGMDWSPSWEQPNWNSPHDVRAALLIRTVSRFHGCPNDVVIEFLLLYRYLDERKWNTALHWTWTNLENHVCNHSPSGWEMAIFANKLSTIWIVWRGLQQFVQRWNVPKKSHRRNMLSLLFAGQALFWRWFHNWMRKPCSHSGWRWCVFCLMLPFLANPWTLRVRPDNASLAQWRLHVYIALDSIT